MSFMSQVQSLVGKSSAYDQDKAWLDSTWNRLQCANRHVIVPTTSLFANSAVALLPTDWAVDQIAKKLGPSHFGDGSKKMLPSDYLSAWDTETYDLLMNRHFDQGGDKAVQVLSYKNAARAFLSEMYAIVTNTEALQWALDAFTANGNDASGYKMIEGWVSPDTTFLKAICYNRPTPDGPYGVGVFIKNGEIGNYKVVCQALIQRGICTNTITVKTDDSFESFHKGDKSVIKMLFRAAITRAIVTSTTLVDKMLASYEVELPNISDVIAKMAKAQGWGNEFTTQVALGTADSLTQRSLGGLVNGISAAAQTIEDPEERAKMETLAGQILVAPPGSLFAEAAKMVYVEVER